MKFLDDWIARTDGHANTTGNQGKTAAPPSWPTRGLFVIGTDTDVGKSYTTALMIRHLGSQALRVGVYKPVASGVTAGVPGDADLLNQAAGGDWPLERVCPQSFRAALAPPIAAVREGRQVDTQLLSSGASWWRGRCDLLVVEGAGGALSPLSYHSTVLDLAVEMGYPVVLVAAHRLGMMNHVLLTLEAMAHRQLDVLALVINQVQPTLANQVADEHAVRLEESLGCLLPFCGKISCWALDYQGSTLFPVHQ